MNLFNRTLFPYLFVVILNTWGFFSVLVIQCVLKIETR